MTIPVVDRRYQMTETKKAKEIIERAMNLAREEIPKGAVATYIPELGKEDPHQLGICLYPLTGDKICIIIFSISNCLPSVGSYSKPSIARQTMKLPS